MSSATARRGGGLAWTVWALGTAFYAYGFFQRVAPSVMVSELMREFAATAVVLGNLSAFYFYAYAGLQLPLGVVLDALGPRRVMAAGALVAALGSTLFGAAETLGLAYLGRLLIGAGVAVALIGTLKLAMAWFPARRFATVSGLTMLVGTLGAVAGQAPLAAFVEAVGWRAALLWAATFGLLMAVLLWTVVRDQPAPAPLAPGGATAAQPSIAQGLRRILANPQTWLIALYSGMMSAPWLTFAGLWGVPFAMVAYGLDRSAAAAAMSVVLIGFAVGAPLGGWISDAMSRRRPVMIGGAAGCLVTWLLILYLRQPPMAVIYVVFFLNGWFSGTVIIMFALAREHNAPQFGGTLAGFINTAGIGTVAILQPSVGYVLDLLWTGEMQDGLRLYAEATYLRAFLAFPACAAVALVASVVTRETHCRQQVH